jgi:zinc D-Ala-D-Ala carboxypeptidase
MPWKYFRPDEFRCKGVNCCGGANQIRTAFVDRLDVLRSRCGFPLVVTSGYRCPVHNARVSSTGDHGPHTTGMAVDIAVSRHRAWKLIGEALAMGFTGIGIKQHGTDRFVHLDDLKEPIHAPRPTIWTYP